MGRSETGPIHATIASLKAEGVLQLPQKAPARLFCLDFPIHC